eukprot:COSAG06_NODE_34313_length_476_cov_1.336870_1_plen_107_part_01
MAGKNRSLLRHFILEKDHFTKTGSGQTWENSKRERFLAVLLLLLPVAVCIREWRRFGASGFAAEGVGKAEDTDVRAASHDAEARSVSDGGLRAAPERSGGELGAEEA